MSLSRRSLCGPGALRIRAASARKPALWRVQEGDDCVVVKDFAESGLVARWLGAWLVQRELRAYRQLEGHPAVPRVRAVIDSLAFAVEYRPGEVMGTGLAGRVSPDFVTALRQAVREMHARGVVHLDLRHRSNVLAEGGGQRPVLIDFASALCFRPRSTGARVVLPLLAWIDLLAVDKWERQLRGIR